MAESRAMLIVSVDGMIARHQSVISHKAVQNDKIVYFLTYNVCVHFIVFSTGKHFSPHVQLKEEHLNDVSQTSGSCNNIVSRICKMLSYMSIVDDTFSVTKVPKIFIVVMLSCDKLEIGLSGIFI